MAAKMRRLPQVQVRNNQRRFRRPPNGPIWEELPTGCGHRIQLLLLLDQVQGKTHAEPIDLLSRIGVVRHNGGCARVQVFHFQGPRPSRSKGIQIKNHGVGYRWSAKVSSTFAMHETRVAH